MPISSNSFIDSSYYESISSETIDNDDRFVAVVNSVIFFMEDFCNRPLKAKDYSYDSEDEGYGFEKSVFDPPKGISFYFPTYPVNSISEFIISDTTIVESTAYNDYTGYFLYKSKGELVYYNGFDYGYNQNIKTKWNGGYVSTHANYSELQHIQYLITKKFYEDDTIDVGIIGETLGNYKYQLSKPEDLAQFLNLPIFVFKRLMNYRRSTIA